MHIYQMYSSMYGFRRIHVHEHEYMYMYVYNVQCTEYEEAQQQQQQQQIHSSQLIHQLPLCSLSLSVCVYCVS